LGTLANRIAKGRRFEFINELEERISTMPKIDGLHGGLEALDNVFREVVECYS